MASSSSTVNFYQLSVSLPLSSSPIHHHKLLHSQLSFASSFNSCISFRLDSSRLGSRLRKSQSPYTPNFVVVASAKAEPLKVMISGAPASGKGTQCELIEKKYGLAHIAAGDLLRVEIASASENGRRAKEYMEKGQLVPNEIVVMMVKKRLLQPDAQQNGWLLDGYPRSLSQATALKEFGFQPDLFVLLDVPEEILVARVVGHRSDPITGKVNHLKYSPPETDEIAARLTLRFDDTGEGLSTICLACAPSSEDSVRLRLQTHNQNVEAVLSIYEDITVKVNGTLSKQDVFARIESALSKLLEERKARSGSLAA